MERLFTAPSSVRRDFLDRITYSFDKTQREKKILLFDDSTRWEIARQLLKMTAIRHHNASVLKFSEHRKEKEDGSVVNRKSSS